MYGPNNVCESFGKSVEVLHPQFVSKTKVKSQSRHNSLDITLNHMYMIFHEFTSFNQCLS